MRLRLGGDQAAAIHISQSPVRVEGLLLGVRGQGLGGPFTHPTVLLTVLPERVCMRQAQVTKPNKTYIRKLSV